MNCTDGTKETRLSPGSPDDGDKGSAANETEKWEKKKLENINRYKGHLADIASYGGITGSSLGKKMTNYEKSSELEFVSTVSAGGSVNFLSAV